METRKILLSCCIAFLAPLAAQAQFNVFMPENNVRPDSIGLARIRVQYDTSFCIDTAKKEKPQEETMILEIGTGVSKFFSYGKYLCDSIYEADIANKASQETINQHLSQYSTSRLTEIVSKGFPTGQVTTQNAVAGLSHIRYQEKLEWPKWKLTEETDTILGSSCRKAKCDFKGRHWIAWFTEAIPVSEGPWKLGGLPGLILKAYDSEHEYNFTAIGIEQYHTHKPITLRLKNYESVSRKQYQKIHDRYYDDPIGFVNGSSPNVTMTVTDSSGNKMRPRGIAHNPIERD